ncbi:MULTISPECIES: type II toxin-antitoxin system ParD family antitoxin [Rhizobium]|uniref:Type II toxin-antitoxin system ParD family antitoxin n=1 Tax=Rhizobium aouanii TaxID=3118145 RepID=A0ABU8CJ03_9HYPH|nr:type II toxin-antitoxin system ParD family antitoxin [Rhizobium acaciae]MCW1410727.1 type II toxin-antitoxin system ParD family antitoxin [Rhizobium acaciae]MCW1742974.1 type II toxin-antitoxin system ParD family antitoxin [Rhizobium acaciae]MCW1750170.1 type II toxin-antitoxin system ParD family antitoxin [Rhizobium acaciae]
MANVEKISVSMTPQQADLLRDAVQSGAYASSSEVIREAMRDWSAKWQQRRGDIQKMREMWAEGKASGAASPVDFDEVLEEARQELKADRGHGG